MVVVMVQVQQVVLASRQYSPRVELFSSLARAANLPQVLFAVTYRCTCVRLHLGVLGVDIGI